MNYLRFSLLSKQKIGLIRNIIINKLLLLSMNTKLEEFIFYSQHANSIKELFAMYEVIMKHYGFDHLAHAVISDHDELKNGSALGLTVHNELNGWEKHYLEQNYIAIDLAPQITYSKAGFFTWHDMKQQALSREQSAIFNEAEDFKLYSGVNVSIHNANGVKCVIIAASNQQGFSVNQYTKDIVNLLAHQFNTCFLSLTKHELIQKKIPLTQKEEEILKWISKGLSKPEIGDKMNISSHTVSYYMRSIFKKMGTNNTVSTVIKAIKEELIVI
ncbi:Transcriptional activator protein vanR [gamma proteobacterium IMCC1989]|nr:Transcriptional activator protein vanR [gamma proteobacterium IMCC1989]